MSHRNAPLSETGRLRLASCVVDDGWPLRRAAERFQVSPTTAARWASRYRRVGAAGMVDRSSPAASLTAADADADGAADHQAAGDAAVGAGADRLPPRPASLDGAPGAVPLRSGAAGLARPRHRADGPPLRARRTGRPGPCRRQEARPIPDGGGGWRMHGREPRPRHTARPRMAGSATTSCTPRSTTTPAWPTASCYPTSKATPPRRSGAAPRLVRRPRHHRRTGS